MKKTIYFFCFFSLSLNFAYSQKPITRKPTPRHTTVLKPDSALIKKDSLINPSKRVISEDEINLKGKPKEEVDTTLSYSEEYRRGAVSTTWGFRGGLTLGQMSLASLSPVRINQDPAAGGLPLRDTNGKLLKDSFSPVNDFGAGYSAAIFVRISRGSFFFQPELIYAAKAGSFDIIKADGSINRISTKLTHVDVPLLIGIRFRQGRVFAGPVVNFPLSIDNNLETALRTYINPQTNFKSEILSRPLVNLQAGLGFDLKHIVLDARYEVGLANTINYGMGSASNPSNFSFATNVIHLSIGYIF